MTSYFSISVYILFLFCTSISAATPASDSLFTQKLNAYLCEQPIEKVYIHQDRTAYYAGETIWFKVYQTLSSQAERVSKIVYLDLANGSEEIIAQVKYPLVDGLAAGSIQIPSNLPAGHYQLRAYTRWMQNFNTDGFFHRELCIYGNTSNYSEKKQDLVKLPDYQLNFFPEGGYMVEGLVSKVAFEFASANKEDFSLEGVILNEQGDSVQKFATTYQRKGSFFFQPQKGERYTVHLNGYSKCFQLPEILPEGFVCTVKQFENVLRILITQNLNPVNLSQRYTLVLHQEGFCFTQLPIDNSESRTFLDIPVDKLPSGIFTLSLIDENYQVYCERLVFTKFPETLNLEFYPSVSQEEGCRRMSIDILARNGQGAPQQGNFSLAIAQSLLENPALHDNFKIWFSLSSELKGVLEQPSDYWHPDDPTCLSRIELLLLTQGWCRYSLGALHRPISKLIFPMEQSLSLRGKINNITRRKSRFVSVQAVIRQDSLQQFMVCPLDTEKCFNLSGFSFYGKAHVLLSAIDEKGKTFPITLEPPFSAPEVIYLPSPFVQDSAFYVEWKFLEPSLTTQGIDKQVFDLGEVSVTARKRDKIEKRRTHYSENFVRTSVEVKEANSFGDVRSLLRKIPFVVMMNNPDQTNAYHTYAHIVGTSKNSVATFVLDGFVLKDPEMAYSLSAAQIERVEVLRENLTSFGGFKEENNEGIIALYSRRPGEGVPTVDNKLICEWIGYDQTKEFYVPDETDVTFFMKKEQRNTIYWNPNIRTDAEGKARVSFYLNENEKGKYVIHCEGRSKERVIGADFKIVKF